MSKNLLSQCFIKEGKFKPQILGGETEITIRELLVSEAEEFRRLLVEENQKSAMYYAVKCSMVEPSFFTDKELDKLNMIGATLIQEIFAEIPLIGKNKKEREDYFKKVEELTKAKIENETDVKAEVEEEAKK